MRAGGEITLKELLEIFGDSPSDLIKLKYVKAKSHKQRLDAVDAAIDWIVAEMSKSARHNMQANEDSLTVQIVGFLKAMGFQASHDTDVGGHCDIVIEGKGGFLWLAEAKIHRDYPWLLKGFRQLTSRYSTGLIGQNAGGLIIYSRRPRIDQMMKAWSEHLQENEPGVTVSPCPKTPLAFVSKQTHVRTGDEFTIRHVPVSLYFDPKDRQTKNATANKTGFPKHREFSSRRPARRCAPASFHGLCDDEAVPLICPTCQASAQSAGAGSGDRQLLCMGLFSIFYGGTQRPGASVRHPA
jgi:hypothetical protein